MNCCDPGRNRTCDHELRRHVLYPLSYGAVNGTKMHGTQYAATIVTAFSIVGAARSTDDLPAATAGHDTGHHSK